jgi:hypothetical protein
MIYSVAPVSCTAELHLHFPLFMSDVSLQVAQLSCDFLIKREHIVLYEIAARAHILAAGCYVQFEEPPTTAFWQTAEREAGLRCALYVSVPGCTRAAQ